MADPLLQVWFHCVVTTDRIPCAIASRLSIDELPIRVLPIGVGFPDLWPWNKFPRLFMSEVGTPVVNIVCVPPKFQQGTEMKTEKGEVVYRPVTALAGLLVPEAFNAAIVYPLHRKPDLEIEKEALAKYDLRIVLAQQDVFDSAVFCRGASEISQLIKEKRCVKAT